MGLITWISLCFYCVGELQRTCWPEASSFVPLSRLVKLAVYSSQTRLWTPSPPAAAFGPLNKYAAGCGVQDLSLLANLCAVWYDRACSLGPLSWESSARAEVASACWSLPWSSCSLCLSICCWLCWEGMLTELPPESCRCRMCLVVLCLWPGKKQPNAHLIICT